MHRSNDHSHPWGRALEVALVLGAAGFVLANLFSAARRGPRDRRQQVEALRTWEGEGGALRSADRTSGAVSG